MVIAAIGCKSSAPPDPGLEVDRMIAGNAVTRLEQELAEARAKNPARTPDVGFLTCAKAAASIVRLRASPDVALASKLDEICNYELPRAELAAAVAAVEADSTMDESAKRANACYETTYADRARQTIERAGRTDADVTGLAARYDARCPH